MLELPIEQHLASIEDALDTHSRLILVAQPGAGKTTRVPLRLIERPWARWPAPADARTSAGGGQVGGNLHGRSVG